MANGGPSDLRPSLVQLNPHRLNFTSESIHRLRQLSLLNVRRFRRCRGCSTSRGHVPLTMPHFTAWRNANDTCFLSIQVANGGSQQQGAFARWR